MTYIWQNEDWPHFFFDKARVESAYNRYMYQKGIADGAFAMLSERARQMMIAEGDAFIALPGGTGTLDEITEVMSLRRLGKLGDKRRPVMLYNINGYYDRLFEFLDRMTDEEFHRPSDRENILEVCSIEDIEKVLSTAGEPVPERNTLYDR